MIEFFKTDATGATSKVASVEPGCWVNVSAPTKEERRWLAEELGVVSEFITSAFDDEESSHVDFDDDTGQALVIVDYPAIEDAREVEDSSITQYDTQPLSMLFVPQKKVVVTVCLFPCETITSFTMGKVRQFDTRMRTRFLLQVLYHISQQYLLCLRSISRQFVKTEKQLRRSLKNQDLIKMLGLEKSLLYFSTSLKADQATLSKIRLGRTVKLYEEDQELLDDVLIEVQQAITSILTRTMDTFGSVISNSLNSVMRTLTVITVVLAIPTIIFSFYGMNVEDLPLVQTWLFPAALSLVGAAVTAVVLLKGKFFR